MAVRTREGDAEQYQPGDRQSHSAALERRQRHLPVTRDHHRQDPHPAGRGRLNERQRRKREREHVEQPADCFDCEPEEPAALAEQKPHGAKRVPRRERRQPRRDTVFDQVANVQRARRNERGDERGRGLHLPS